MTEFLSRITIDLHEPARHGTAQIVFRCAHEDRKFVTAASHRVGLSVSEFMRVVVIQAAKQIINSAKPTKYESVVYEKDTTMPEPVLIDPSLPPGAKP